jgi:hypothetical protein
MEDKKHYVYSARTTEKGLALLNRTKGDRSWDSFVNKAVSEHYGLALEDISLPPSKFLAEREEKRKAREAKKARKAAEKKAKEKPKKATKKTAKEAKEDAEK